jgi:transcriptional regulator of acetoin/glycerol metabolism
MKYDWPGNVRELKNVVRRALISCGDASITPANLPRRLVEPAQSRGVVTIPLGKTLEQAEKILIERALDHVDGNKSESAKLLGITRAGLYKKMRRHNISG